MHLDQLPLKNILFICILLAQCDHKGDLKAFLVPSLTYRQC